MYKRCYPTQIFQTYQHLIWIILFVYIRYYWIFIELCPIVQQKRRRPDATAATTYSRRRTNNRFYRPAKIILYILRVGNRSFHYSVVKETATGTYFLSESLFCRLPANLFVSSKWQKCLLERQGFPRI